MIIINHIGDACVVSMGSHRYMLLWWFVMLFVTWCSRSAYNTFPQVISSLLQVPSITFETTLLPTKEYEFRNSKSSSSITVNWWHYLLLTGKVILHSWIICVHHGNSWAYTISGQICRHSSVDLPRKCPWALWADHVTWSDGLTALMLDVYELSCVILMLWGS